MASKRGRGTPKRATPKQRSPGVDTSLKRNGGLSYLELPATDIRKSAQFYQKVLGWILRESGGEPSKFSDPGGHLIGRWALDRAVSRKPGLLAFFYVDRLEEAVKQVAARGGEIVKAPHPKGDVLIAIVRDPAGNMLGLWQEAGS